MIVRFPDVMALAYVKLRLSLSMTLMLLGTRMEMSNQNVKAVKLVEIQHGKCIFLIKQVYLEKQQLG